MFRSDDGGKDRHELTLFEGRDLVERLAGLHIRPVGFELASVQYRPCANQPQRSRRLHVARPHLPVEIERRMLA